MRAIDFAVRLAENARATLIPVSLISTPTRGVRLEHIQQSKDFLEAVKYKAARLHVPLERYEVFTPNVQQSLTTLVRERLCDGIVLVTDGERARLMRDEEVKQLLLEPPVSLVLIRLSHRSGELADSRSSAGFLAQLRGRWQSRKAATLTAMQDEVADEEPLWVRTEPRHLHLSALREGRR